MPELWLYDQSLKIYILRDGEYVESELSSIFGDIPIRDVILQFLEMSLSQGRSKAMKAFRVWMQENLFK